MGDESLLLIAQNGYGNYERAVSMFGKGRVLLSRIIFGSEIIEYGRVKVTVCADDVVIGDPAGVVEENFLRELAKTLESSWKTAHIRPLSIYAQRHKERKDGDRCPQRSGM